MKAPRWSSFASASALAAVVALTGCGATDVGSTLPPGPATLAEHLGPWRPVPLVVDPALLARAAQACRTDMGTDPDMKLPANLPLAVADARGGGRLQVLLAGPRHRAECVDMAVLATGEVHASGGGGISTLQGDEPPPAPQHLEITGASSSGGRRQLANASNVWGQAGSDIRSVTVSVVGQPPILATLSGSWFAAWWPGPTDGGTVRVVGFDGSGAAVAEASL